MLRSTARGVFWLSKHAFKAVLIFICVTPLIALAVWLTTLDTDLSDSIVDLSWAIGTLVRIGFYAIFIDSIYLNRIENTLANYQYLLDQLDSQIANLWRDADNLELTEGHYIQDALETKAGYERTIEALVLAKRATSKIWMGAILLELLLQLSFFTVLS